MALTRLIGDAATDHSGWPGLPANYARWNKWTADATGSLSEVRIWAANSGNAKVALYANNGGVPGTRLGKQDTSTAVTGGQWNPISLEAPVSVVQGVEYWIAHAIDTNGACVYLGDTGRGYQYLAITYSTWTWPTTPSGQTDAPGYKTSAAGWGEASVPQTITPSSTVQPIGYGTPAVQLGAAPQTIIPSSIIQSVAYGTPALLYPQTISPSSTVQAIVIGIPTIIGGGTGLQVIIPTSIVQQISIGSPTILKYVWHVILDGRYNIESPEVNRAYVIGRDIYGNPVYGTAVDSAELGLVGERLDFQQELAIPTSSQAGSMADAILSKMRLTGKRGVILIPPNCGQELFDVVEVTDSKGNQQAVKFRVVGIRFEYNPRQARYQQKLILGAP